MMLDSPKWELRNCIIVLRNCLLQSWPASCSRFLIIWTIIWSGRFSKSFNNSFGVSIWSPCNLFTIEMHITEPFTPALLQNERKRFASISMLRMPCWNYRYLGENGRWSSSWGPHGVNVADVAITVGNFDYGLLLHGLHCGVRIFVQLSIWRR